MTLTHEQAMQKLIEAHELGSQVRGHRDAAKALMDLLEWIDGTNAQRDQILAEIRYRADLILKHGNKLAQQAQAALIADAPPPKENP